MALDTSHMPTAISPLDALATATVKMTWAQRCHRHLVPSSGRKA